MRVTYHCLVDKSSVRLRSEHQKSEKNSTIQTIFEYIAMRVLDNGDKNNVIINHASTRACHLRNEWNILTP